MPRPKKKKPNSDGYYRVTKYVIAADGTRKKKAFRSKISQEDAQAQADAYDKTHTYSNTTFAEWANVWLYEYKYNQVRGNTFEYTYKSVVINHLVPYFGRFKLDSISNSMIQAFFNKNSNLSSSLLNKMRICLTQMYDTAIANQIVTFSPCTVINAKSNQKKKEKATFSKKEVAEIIESSKTHRFGMYINILITMGLRISELCGLKWEDIDFKKGTMSIQRACTDLNGSAVIGEPKNDKSKRTIPIPQELLKVLKSERKTGYIVVSATNKNISPRTFTSKRYNVFFKDTGIRKLTPHEMRHTCGTLLYEKCHDIYAVQAFLGHTNAIVTSGIYVHSNPEDLKKQLFS